MNDNANDTPAVPSGSDVVVESSPSGYVLRRAGTNEVIGAPFSVFGNAITAARTLAAGEGVNVWMDAAGEVRLVTSASDVGPPGRTERRRNRLRIPPCPRCGPSVPVEVVSRTPFVLYVRCSACLFAWDERKPGQSGFLGEREREG